MNRWIQIIAALALIATAAGCAGLLVLLAPQAERAEPPPRVATVDVIEARALDQIARVTATGTVEPAQEVRVLPEVSGRIIYVYEALVPGGRLKKGEVYAKIDPRDFDLQVRQEHSRVEQAKLELSLERGRQAIARREWDLLGNGRDGEEAPLALRKPQLAAAERAVEAAVSGLEIAKLRRERTVLRAPFNAVVTSESVDVGQVVGPLNQVATLVGTDALWVRVSVPVEDLSMIDIPGVSAETGSPVEVVQRLRGGDLVRKGQVLQLVGALDPQTRTAQLLIEVADPMASGERGLPLLPGAYVEVGIAGRVLSDTFAVPRAAIFDGDKLWVVSADDTLERRVVDIAWRTADEVIVRAGLEDGDQVIVSPMALPIAGMAVQIRPGADQPVGAATTEPVRDTL